MYFLEWLIPTANAQVVTSTVISAVSDGVTAGAGSVTAMIGDNIGSLLILGGLILGIFLIWKLFRRMAK